MTMTQSTDERFNHIEERLDSIEQKLDLKFDKLSSEIIKISSDVEKISSDVEKSNEKFEIYRQANQSLVNLAFGLIASATVGVVVSLIFKR